MNNHCNWKEEFPPVPPQFHQRVCDTLHSLPTERDITMMNKQAFRRGLVLAVITTMLLSTVVYGVTRIYSTGSHTNKADGGYTTAPTAQTLDKDIDVPAIIPTAFANGYRYQVGYVAQAQNMDENDQVLDRFQDFSCNYTKDEAVLFLDAQDAATAGEMDSFAQQVFDLSGISVRYAAYTTKLAPPDYVKTQEEKAEEAAGRLNFAYAGSSEITVEQTQILWWMQDGVFYQMTATDSPLTAQDLADMAAEVITAQ